MNPQSFKESYSIGGVGFINCFFDNAGLLVQAQVSGLASSLPTTSGAFATECTVVDTVAGITYQNQGDSSTVSWVVIPTNTSVQILKVSLSSAQILALNGTPIQLVPAPGAGKVIDVLNVIGKMSFLTAAYATNTTLDVVYHGQTAGILQNTTLLPIASGILIDSFVAGTQPQLLSNTALDITVDTGNPSAGAGSLILYVTYKVITL